MPKSHIDEIDFQRAILIALVIFVHIVNFGNIHPNVKSGVLSFLMPTFLLVTGYLVKKSEIEKLRNKQQSLNNVTVFGKGAQDGAHALDRRIQRHEDSAR